MGAGNRQPAEVAEYQSDTETGLLHQRRAARAVLRRFADCQRQHRIAAQQVGIRPGSERRARSSTIASEAARPCDLCTKNECVDRTAGPRHPLVASIPSLTSRTSASPAALPLICSRRAARRTEPLKPNRTSATLHPLASSAIVRNCSNMALHGRQEPFRFKSAQQIAGFTCRSLQKRTFLWTAGPQEIRCFASVENIPTSTSRFNQP